MDLKLLNNFNSELKSINEYIYHIELINDLANSKPDEYNSQSFKTFLLNHKKIYIEKKEFEYKAIIISLYGLLEKYVELFLKEYLKSLINIYSNYNDLNQTIINHHFELSLELLKKIDSMAKFDNLDKKEILTNLNSCLVDPENYVLNSDAFLLSSNGNLRHSKICELFGKVDVKLLSLIKKSKTFINSENSENTFNTIDELVNRRNDVAHGAEKYDRLDNTELFPFVVFLENYFKELHGVLSLDINQKRINYEIKKNYEEINILRNFPNKFALGFEDGKYNYQIGQQIILKNKELLLFETTILNYSIHEKEKNVTIEIKPFIDNAKKLFLKKI